MRMWLVRRRVFPKRVVPLRSPAHNHISLRAICWSPRARHSHNEALSQLATLHYDERVSKYRDGKGRFVKGPLIPPEEDNPVRFNERATRHRTDTGRIINSGAVFCDERSDSPHVKASFEEGLHSRTSERAPETTYKPQYDKPRDSQGRYVKRSTIIETPIDEDMRRTTAGQKRRATRDPINDDFDALENIVVASAKTEPERLPLGHLPVAQAQNKRRRVVDHVLIPKPSQAVIDEAVPYGLPSLQRTAAGETPPSPSESVSPEQSRPKRAGARRSYVPQQVSDEESEDEIAGHRNMPVPKSRNAKPMLTEASDFEDDYEGAAATSPDYSEADPTDDEDSVAPEEEASDDDVGSKSKRMAAPVQKASTTKRELATGKSKVKATQHNMKNLLPRPRGLDTSLPPLHKSDEIFADIVEKARQLGILEILKKLGGRPLRVATMCSGTESPLLALQQFQDILPDLRIEHVFSAEIVPFKQAYFERNFKPPIIFRDIRELTAAVKDEVPMATTAYGAKVPIPRDIDILIAGTSCVDFSNLNNRKKELSDGGESGQTFDAVLAFANAFHPTIVVLENVKNAPYDSKDFYVPQTRQRGYMVCFDRTRMKSAGVKSLREEWQTLVGRFRRPASSPVSSFLLRNDQINRRRLTRPDDDVRKEVDWSRCEITQAEYRHKNRLGTGRPYTDWQESGIIGVPEDGIAIWYYAQVERVLDTIDASLLRKALEMYDVRFKTRPWDLSQNIYRNKDITRFGLIGCITPSGQVFISDAGRPLEPEEALILQGLPPDKISFTTETPAEVQDLAGNAMTAPVVGSAILSALIAGHGLLADSGALNRQSTTNPPKRPLMSPLPLATPSEKFVSGKEDTKLSEIVRQAKKAMRRCYCESSGGVALKPIQYCADCGHTTCIACGGKPKHNYRQRQELFRARPSLGECEAKLKSKLPLRLRLETTQDFAEVMRQECDDPKFLVSYTDILKQRGDNAFSMSHFRRTHCLTAVYTSTRYTLELVLWDTLYGNRTEWRLFAIPPKHLPSNDKLRNALTQPIATCLVVDKLFGDQWRWRSPLPEDESFTLKGHGAMVPSWWSRLGLPDFKDHAQWEYITVSRSVQSDVPVSSKGTTGEDDIDGTYQYLPRCGTACESLYKRKDSQTSKLPMFLFLDPERNGEPKEDCFVFSTDMSKLEYDEVRSIVARVEPAWRPWDQSEPDCIATVNRDWNKTVGHGTLRPEDSILEIRRPKQTASGVRCRDVVPTLECEIATNHETDPAGSEHLVRVDSHDSGCFAAYAWVIQGIRHNISNDRWFVLEASNASELCHDCAPKKPALKWKRGDDGKSIAPYEDPRAAADYERAVKNRPTPILVDFQRSRSPEKGSEIIRLGIDWLSLAHRAQARLPKGVRPITYKGRLIASSSTSSSSLASKPFRLSSTKGVKPYNGILELSVDLFPKQRQSLAWMRQQEAGLGQRMLLEETEEASLPKAGLTVEVCAQTSLSRRGGILAHHPGFGKTIVSLALIQAQHLESPRADILKELRVRQNENVNAKGLLPTAATLIVCPGTLVKQWRAEVHEKLGYNERSTLVINSVADLSKYSIEDFEAAKIVIFNRSVLASEKYAERLGAFAGVPGPATLRGRAFGHWLRFAVDQVPEHLHILQNISRDKLKAHLKDRYAENLASERFISAVPSRRLRGEAYVAAAEKRKTTSKTSKPPSFPVNLDCVEKPLLQHFFWNRIIIDEFHAYETQDHACLSALSADKRWGLSGTPAIGDSYDIAALAALLDAPLPIGSDARGLMKQKNARELRKDMTDAERFDAMREPYSDRAHARLHDRGQKILDDFVRRDTMDGAQIDVHDTLVPVSLDLDHRVVYTELLQQLNSWDMRIKKSSRSKDTNREETIFEAVAGSETAEEALSKTGAFFGRDAATLVALREQEAARYMQKLHSAVLEARTHDTENFESWKSAMVENGDLGDDQTMSALQDICNVASSHSGCVSKGRKTKKRRTSTDDLDEEPAQYDGVGATEEARVLTARANAIANRVLVANRSLRFLQNIQVAKEAANTADSKGINASAIECDDPDCPGRCTAGQDVAISAYCGHMLCKDCHERKRKKHAERCPAHGCSASMRDQHMLTTKKMGDLRNPRNTPFGAKLEAAVGLLQKIETQGDQAILFVQCESQLSQVRKALSHYQIPATVVEESRFAGQQIADFRESPEKTVIVLNASDETAAGSNLQNANHVIFLSPLLRDTQYGYDSTMAQAVGRVRRHGQKKSVHVYRIIAFDTIDVDILEHRERRSDALIEQGMAKVTPPAAAKALDVHDEPVLERTQLVRENGEFSLRPQSWLMKCGAEEDYEEVSDVNRVQGKGRVAGWEDFSSLVKFSRAYSEDD